MYFTSKLKLYRLIDSISKSSQKNRGCQCRHSLFYIASYSILQIVSFRFPPILFSIYSKSGSALVLLRLTGSLLLRIAGRFHTWLPQRIFPEWAQNLFYSFWFQSHGFYWCTPASLLRYRFFPACCTACPAGSTALFLLLSVWRRIAAANFSKSFFR